ncbi:MAG: retroviral-like aspartic protease family protein [Odoribacteraceae bacterium]|jgi:hypothetical protein|nr:retroviral-like aspartic protease family protein [Odoribacteraceae bacterium]
MEEIQVPVELVELDENSFHIIVTVVVGCIEGDFIVDTGASITVIDEHTPFTHEPLQGTRGINSGGIGGEIGDVKLVNLPAFRLGEHTLENVRGALMDLQYVNTLYYNRLRRRIAGLIGCDFLIQHNAIIDYENKRLTLKVSSRE